MTWWLQGKSLSSPAGFTPMKICSHALPITLPVPFSLWKTERKKHHDEDLLLLFSKFTVKYICRGQKTHWISRSWAAAISSIKQADMGKWGNVYWLILPRSIIGCVDWNINLTLTLGREEAGLQRGCCNEKAQAWGFLGASARGGQTASPGAKTEAVLRCRR